MVRVPPDGRRPLRAGALAALSRSATGGGKRSVATAFCVGDLDDAPALEYDIGKAAIHQMEVPRRINGAGRRLAAHEDEADLWRLEGACVTLVLLHGEAVTRAVEEIHRASGVGVFVEDAEVLGSRAFVESEREKDAEGRGGDGGADAEVDWAHDPLVDDAAPAAFAGQAPGSPSYLFDSSV